MRWFALLLLILVSAGAVIAQDAPAADPNDGMSAPVREPMPQPPGMPELTGGPLKPLPRWTPPVKPVKPVAVTPPVPAPTPPPEPRFDASASPALTLAYPAPEAAVNEGAQTLVWNTSGTITQVKLTYHGERCRLGGRSRGTFSGTIGKFANQGKTQWAVPWMDTTEFTVRVVGYGADGKQLASDERQYQLRPRILEGKPETCIVVSKPRQRLYYVHGGTVQRMHIVSTAAGGYTTPSMRPGSYDRSRGAMGRVFSKAYAPTSHMYHVVMYYWLQITSSGSHGIHATSPPFYGRLGGPASHGCIRQHRADARVLYELVSVGTPVYVQ